jgi:hypothetical protein
MKQVLIGIENGRAVIVDKPAGVEVTISNKDVPVVETYSARAEYRKEQYVHYAGVADWILRKILPFQSILNEDKTLYLRRFYLYRGKRRPHVYIHHICTSDDDRALHDHPWGFKSFMMWGRYEEIMPTSQLSHFDVVETLRAGKGKVSSDEVHGEVILRQFSAPCFLRREDATNFHRLILPTWKDNNRQFKTVWTLVFTGERVREWGFLLKTGWVKWTEFRQAMMDAMGMGD